MAMFACLPRKHLQTCFLYLAGLLAVCAAHPALAQVGSARYASIIVDAGSGNVLEAVNADQPRRPASLAKLMTLYMAFEALRDRRISLNETVPVSPHAASMEPSKLGLVPGTHLTVQEAILGLVTKSANDAASALGELLGGSEDRFAQMMTLRARGLGMMHTTFGNASGLPDPENWTTARDLATLARHLISDFPSDYRYFSTPSFVWHRQVIFNHDNMLKSYPGADGMKTGYTDASGHNLLTSALRGGVRLIGVVLGAGSNGERDIHMASLLNAGFEQMDVPIVRKPPVQMASRVTLVASARAAEVPRALARATHMANWSVHVGTFPTQAAAHSAALRAEREADAGEIKVEPVRVRGKVVWRASVVGLTQSDASDACSGRRKSCQMINPRSRVVASR
ncbi:MAG TPA: D-alanyl-D-alanine carboxypeptidase family protein [Rhodopila sp.]|jgi:D-alanyl-D-alanine carboxypeptidase|nr:D-alanyl-D-alanine carboxypeptidase family protein [Rhodopila sp.]